MTMIVEASLRRAVHETNRNRNEESNNPKISEEKANEER